MDYALTKYYEPHYKQWVVEERVRQRYHSRPGIKDPPPAGEEGKDHRNEQDN